MRSFQVLPATSEDKKYCSDKVSNLIPCKLPRANKVKYPNAKSTPQVASHQDKLLHKQRCITISSFSDKTSRSLTTSLRKVHSILDLRIKQAPAYYPDYTLRAISKGISLMLKSHMEITLSKPWAISDNSLKEFAYSLEESTNLRCLSLNLQGDRLTNKGLKALGKSLKRLKALSKLSLNLIECNSITSKGIFQLSLGLRCLKKLTKFELNLESCERISQDILSIIPNIPIRTNYLNGFYFVLESNRFNLIADGFNELTSEAKRFEINYSRCRPLSSKCLQLLSKKIAKTRSIDLLNLNLYPGPEIPSDEVDLFLSSLLNGKVFQEVNIDSKISPNYSSLAYLKQNTTLSCLSLKVNSTEALDNHLGIDFFPTFRNISTIQLHIKRGEKGTKPEHITSIVNSFHNWPNLRHVSLIFSIFSFSKFGIATLANSLEQCRNITSLDLALHECSKLDNQGLIMIAKSLEKLVRLTSLGLALDKSMQITEVGMEYLMKVFSQLPNLNILDLKFNNLLAIDGQSFEHIGLCSESLQNLEHLNLGFFNCRFLSLEGVNAICNAFKRLKKITNLRLHLLQCQNIRDDCLDVIYHRIAESTTLESVELDFSLCENLSSLKFSIFTSKIKDLDITSKIISNFTWLYAPTEI